jgi:hypothetical protein
VYQNCWRYRCLSPALTLPCQQTCAVAPVCTCIAELADCCETREHEERRSCTLRGLRLPAIRSCPWTWLAVPSLQVLWGVRQNLPRFTYATYLLPTRAQQTTAVGRRQGHILQLPLQAVALRSPWLLSLFHVYLQKKKKKRQFLKTFSLFFLNRNVRPNRTVRYCPYFCKRK